MIREKANILIVSDNSELTSFFQREVEKQGCTDSALFTYAYSSNNQNPSSMIAVGAFPVDVKDSVFCDKAIKVYSLVISLHCKQIFPRYLVESVPCVNFHPGLNPFNRGWYPQVFSIINKKPIGTTLHIMDAEVDHGSIIDQKKVIAEVSDTSLELYKRVIEAEKELIRNNLVSLVEMTFSVRNMDEEGNYNSIKDFKKLCKLDLDEKGTLGSHLDLLRALTHGDFKNAYFVDGSGKRHYVRIIIESE